MPILICDSGENKPGQTDVQDKITEAISGDTVIIPDGNYTWETTVTVSGKRLTLQGGGIGVTNITDQAGGAGALSTTGTATNFITITGITFIASLAHASGIVQLGGTQFAVTFRFHHCRIVASVGRGISVFYTYGLIDHVTFESSPSIQMLSIHGGSTGGADGGYIPWQQPLTLGTDKACYVEDCSFARTQAAGEDAIDAYAGARVAIRNNTFNTCKWGFHGTDSGAIRSPVSFEISNNTITNNDPVSALACSGTVRGGTGVIYNNTSIANPNGCGSIRLIYYRACDRIGTVLGWGGRGCTGANYEMMSASLSSDRSRVASAILGGTTGATTNAAGYGLDQTVITLAVAGSGFITKDDWIYFGTSVKAYKIVTTSTGDTLTVGAGGTVTIFPAIGRNSIGVVDGTTIPAVATTITDGGFKFSSTPGLLFSEQTGAEGGVFTRYLDSGGAFNAAGSGAGTGGYPCRDQPGVGPGQVVTPIYAWGNIGTAVGSEDNGIGGPNADNCQGHGVQFYMQDGRDYFPNTVHPAYVPLAYPHYLQTGGGGGPDITPPATPTGVRVV